MSLTFSFLIFHTFAEPRICSLWTFDLSEDDGAVAEGMVGGLLTGTTNEDQLVLFLEFQSIFPSTSLRVIDIILFLMVDVASSSITVKFDVDRRVGTAAGTSRADLTFRDPRFPVEMERQRIGHATMDSDAP